MKRYGLLLLLLLVLSIVTGLAVMATNRPYLKMCLSSEVTVDGRATLPLDLIRVDLKMWNDSTQRASSSYQETFNLTSDGQDFGHFEGLSHNRYFDISLLWVKLEWVVPYNDSLVTAYVVIMQVDSIDGTKILELNGTNWALDWLWQNHYTGFRPQDDYLYLVQALGTVLVGGVLGSIYVLATNDRLILERWMHGRGDDTH